MSPRGGLRRRINVVLHLVMTLVIVILLGQLWLFTVMLDAMENVHASDNIALAALICSFVACGAVWTLIRLFLRAEADQ